MASECMTKGELWCCQESTSAKEVAQLMADHEIGAVPVLDSQGKVTGIITDRDLTCRLVAKAGTADTEACEIMSRHVHCVDPETDIREVEAMMERYKILRIPVTDQNDRMLGFISLSDIAHLCRNLQEEHELVTVYETITGH